MAMMIPVEGNVSLRVEDTGGNGKPVFFVHGWPLDLKMFEYQFTILKENGYRCIGLDLRGFGMSAKPWQHYNYDFFADDIQKVINALKLEQKFAILGFSMGGGIVMRYVAKYYPNTLSHVVFMGAAAPSFTKREGFPHGQDRAFCDQIITGLMQNRPRVISEFGKMLFHNPESQGPEIFSWLFAQSMAASHYATVSSAKSLRDEDLRNDMQMISDRNLPVAIFHGLHDKVCPYDLAKLMNKAIEGSKLVQFNEGGMPKTLRRKKKRTKS
ncbi:MAG: alpha/beta fold hydrolase [Nitrososphaeraceae archaeon]